MRFSDFAGRGVDDRNRLPAIIDEEFFTRAMNLAHRKPLGLEPRSIKHTELRVTVACRVRGAVLIERAVGG